MTTSPAAAPATADAGGPDRADGPDILCDNLVRIFSSEGVEVVALQGLDLEVERGELVAIVGASGSGKSTLLTILSGLDQPSAGVARVRAGLVVMWCLPCAGGRRGCRVGWTRRRSGGPVTRW